MRFGSSMVVLAVVASGSPGCSSCSSPASKDRRSAGEPTAASNAVTEPASPPAAAAAPTENVVPAAAPVAAAAVPAAAPPPSTTATPTAPAPPTAKADLATGCEALYQKISAGEPYAAEVVRAGIPNEVFTQKQPRFLHFASTFAECRAIAGGGDKACEGAQRAEECRSDRAFFLAAKGAPGDKSWMVSDCPKEWGAVCDQARAAVTSGDASKCPSDPRSDVLHANCVAVTTGDESKCPVGADHNGCVRSVSRYKLIGQGGLAALADKGTTEDRYYAAAALGRADACLTIARDARAYCLQK
jgi:hypothetical protein